MDLSTNLTGSVPEASEPNSITVENRFDQYAQNSTFRILARESSSGFDRAQATNYSVTLSVIRALTA